MFDFTHCSTSAMEPCLLSPFLGLVLTGIQSMKGLVLNRLFIWPPSAQINGDDILEANYNHMNSMIGFIVEDHTYECTGYKRDCRPHIRA